MSKKSYTIAEFCAAYSVSRAFLYKLWDNGLGPNYYKLGTRRFISVEAAEEWRKQNEALYQPQSA
jgi:hypothetical protein